MKKLIILLTVLASFGGVNCSAQITFTNSEADWLSHKIIQLQDLQKDSAATHANLQDCDSTAAAMSDKFDAMQFKYQETAVKGEECQSDFNKLQKRFQKVLNGNSRLKTGLLITISTTIIEGVALYFTAKR